MSSQDQVAFQAGIRRLKSTGQFFEANQLLASLSDQVKHSRRVAIGIAQLYLVQGQWRLAAQTCEDALESLVEGCGSGDDVLQARNIEVAALEVLSAFISIGRYSKLKTALKIACTVGNSWGFYNPSLSDGPSTLEVTQDERENAPSAAVGDTIYSSLGSVPETTTDYAHYKVRCHSIPSFISMRALSLFLSSTVCHITDSGTIDVIDTLLLEDIGSFS